jgi:septal ring factor EnvC (AmiA/AmiB activator)
VEARSAEPARSNGGERRAAIPSPTLIRELEERCEELGKRNAELEAREAELQAELARVAVALDETAKQRDLYQMSVNVAEERIAKLTLELAGSAEERGPDRRFNQLRRFLARELHPDLAGEDAAERVLREMIFKRVWAKIEQLQ